MTPFTINLHIVLSLAALKLKFAEEDHKDLEMGSHLSERHTARTFILLMADIEAFQLSSFAYNLPLAYRLQTQGSR